MTERHDEPTGAEFLAHWGKDPRLVPYGGGNFGMPLALQAPADGLIVPTARFFLRCNGPVPTIDPAVWRLRIGGLVERELSLSLSDLQALPRRKLTSFIECAGNSRTRFTPPAEGTPWRDDAIGNAEWEGVSLAALLDLAGVGAGAIDVVCQGGDFPGMRRGLPVAVARAAETLLVWRMNGVDLPVAHGGPVRLLVPGWGGIASTKWLVGVEVIDYAFDGFWNADNYVVWTEAGEPVRPVQEMPVKSIIAAPASGAALTAGAAPGRGLRLVRRRRGPPGRGHHRRRRSWVEGASGNGRPPFLGPLRAPLAGAAGDGHRLRARASDERGLTQPTTAPWNAKGYQMNAIHEVVVSVEA